MTLPMDVRLAAEDARMGFVFARRGIIPEACSSWFLPRVVGISRAMEWVATGRVFSAQEALEGGLVRSLHPHGRAARRGARARARDRREHRAGVGRARAPADVADARRRAPDARPPRRLARDGRARAVGRRGRGRHRLPREAPGAASPTSVSDGLPDVMPGWQRARVRVAPPASALSTPGSSRQLLHEREHAARTGRRCSATRASTCAGVEDERAGVAARRAPRAPPPTRAASRRVGRSARAQRVDAHGRLAARRSGSSRSAPCPSRRALVMRETTQLGLGSARAARRPPARTVFVCS